MKIFQYVITFLLLLAFGVFALIFLLRYSDGVMSMN